MFAVLKTKIFFLFFFVFFIFINIFTSSIFAFVSNTATIKLIDESFAASKNRQSVFSTIYTQFPRIRPIFIKIYRIFSPFSKNKTLFIINSTIQNKK